MQSKIDKYLTDNEEELVKLFEISIVSAFSKDRKKNAKRIVSLIENLIIGWNLKQKKPKQV